MQSQKLEEEIRKITDNLSEDDFIYEFLIAFGFTKMSIKRLREGNSNLSKKENQLIIKNKLFYEYTLNNDLYSLIDGLKNDSSTYTHKPRFIIVNNPKQLLAIDTKTKETLAVELNELYKHTDFFLPWTGKEKYVAQQENPADVKAAEKMAHIYDEIVKINPTLIKENPHVLNIFLTRILFCFFAEDTGIFEEDIFTKTIVNHTEDDGSDLADVLSILFKSLDKKDNEKESHPSFVQDFPYVNGKLFKDEIAIPKLNAKVRKLMIECGGQDWKEINPDIFGSMFQAVSVAEVRSGLGQHYTSVPNIMKVIEPLFLNDLREEFEKAETEKKLRKLLDRIYNLKIFDPACGSGNFLIIAYKQLRLLEMQIIKKIEEVTGKQQLMLSQLQLNQFYGIEIDDFACEIARLSLWLAEHQMNRKFRDLFGNCKPTLPLSQSGNIVCANATRLDWEEVCPKGTKGLTHKKMEQMTLLELEQYRQMELQGTEYEVYILGNPPYLGSAKQNEIQKQDLELNFSKYTNYKNLDYIACWFIKGARYIKDANAKLGFVSTNSICQGEQVEMLWPHIFELNIEHYFAYNSFKWTNNAKNNAGVSCVILGLRNCCNATKTIINANKCEIVKNINPYLIASNNNQIIGKTKNPLSNVPKMLYGSKPVDEGNLLLSQLEKEELVLKYPFLNEYIKRYLGSDEYINGYIKYCLWINDDNYNKIKNLPEIVARIKNVQIFRLKSKKEATRKIANIPYKFAEIRYNNSNCIIIPSVSSERREYIPIGFLPPNTVVNNLAFAIYNAELWVFGLLSSKMHVLWVNITAGRLGTGLRYSNTLCYNTFPFPNITDKQKKIIEMHVNNILAEREKHSDKTMAELYDPDKMPQGLREAHHSLDFAIEKCYRQAPFESDEKRLEYLFKMYEIMTDPAKQVNAEEQLNLL